MSPLALCVVCVSERRDVVNMSSLYYGSIPASTFIMDILQIKVASDTSSGVVMCNRCNSSLNNFYKFYKMVRDAQHKYNQLYTDSTTIATNKSFEKDMQDYSEDEDDLPLIRSVNKCRKSLGNCNQFDERQSLKRVKFKSKKGTRRTNSKQKNEDKTKQENMKEKTNGDDKIESDKHNSDECDSTAFSRLRFLLTNNDNAKYKDASVNRKDKSMVDDVKVTSAICQKYTWDDIASTCNPALDPVVSGCKAEPRAVGATNIILEKYKLHEIVRNGKFLLDEQQMNEMFNLYYEMKCEFCKDEKIFDSFDELTQHSLRVHNLPSTVECCGIYASVQDVMEDHILHKHLMTLPKKVSCKVCNKMIERNNQRVHLSTHLPPDKRKFQCKECSKGYYLACYLRSHMERAHPKQSFTCDKCHRVYKNKYSLGLHTKYAHSDNPLLCPECGKTLLCPANFAAHMQKHNGTQDRVKCGKCDAVVLKVSLSAHMRIHRSVKKQCPLCPYKTVHGLREHIKRVHEKINRFSCAVCPMKFFTDTALKNHTASRHTGIPLYSCEFCGKTFMSSGNYHSHRTKMHPKQLAEKQLEKSTSIHTYHIPVSDPSEVKRCNLIDERAEILINVLEKSKHKHYVVDSLPGI